MKISQAGIDAIKRHEGLRLHAYLDSAGVPTVGYGHTQGVEIGQHISQETAEHYLRSDLSWTESAVNNAVRVPISQAQFDALCSLAFNIGESAFKNSTLMQKLNAGDINGAADEFLRWNKATVGGEKVPLAGLTSRRAAERKMFLSDATAAPAPAGDPAQSQESGMPIPIAGIAAALLPSLIESIPKLGKLFSSGSAVAERNVAAAGAVLEVVQQATGAVNAQQAVEKIKADPVALQAAEKAIEERWFKLQEAAEASTRAAREFSVAYAQNHNVRTVVGNLTFLELLSLILVTFTLAGGMSSLLWGNLGDQLRGAVITLMLIGGFTSVVGFWFGSSLGSKKKDDKESS